MKSALLFFTLSLFMIALSGCVSTCFSKGALSAEITSSYHCPYSSAPITVNGELDEPVWAKAKVISFVIPGSFETPISKTEAKIAYDKKYLYVAFKAYDEDIWGMLTERDSRTCSEDVLEVFFKTNPAKDPYFNFEINVQGAVYDAYNAKRGAGSGKRWSQWNCAGLKIAVKVKGTANDWFDKDEYWVLEVAIPFAEIPTLGGKSPVQGDKWTFNLARYDYSIYLPKGKELTSCAPLSKLNYHWHEDWRELIFN